jgi:putative flippase GtrA
MFNSLKKFLSPRYVKFLLVGFLNTIFGYSLYAFFIFIGLHYSLAVLLSTILRILFNFQTIGRLVFKQIKKNLLLRFIIVYMIGYLFNTSSIYLLKNVGLNDYFAGALIVFPLSLLMYFLNSRYVFQK